MLTIQYHIRDAKEKADAVRQNGNIPAIFYGPKEKSTPITIKAGDFKKVWKEAGESSIVVLQGETGEEHEAIIHDIDVHPVSGIARHADFYVIEKGKKIQVGTPLEFIGIAPAVKDFGGTLVKVLYELEIEAMPKDLPHELTVDVGALTTIDSQILAKDIVLPAGVTLITGADEVVAAIDVVKEEVEEPAKTIDDIEVVGAKGKEEVAEGEGEKEAGK